MISMQSPRAYKCQGPSTLHHVLRLFVLGGDNGGDLPTKTGSNDKVIATVPCTLLNGQLTLESGKFRQRVLDEYCSQTWLLCAWTSRVVSHLGYVPILYTLS